MLQVLDPSELTFPFDDVTRIEDMETGREVISDPRAFRKAYLEELAKFLDARADSAAAPPTSTTPEAQTDQPFRRVPRRLPRAARPCCARPESAMNWICESPGEPAGCSGRCRSSSARRGLACWRRSIKLPVIHLENAALHQEDGRFPPPRASSPTIRALLPHEPHPRGAAARLPHDVLFAARSASAWPTRSLSSLWALASLRPGGLRAVVLL